ncbi:hypothetical protein HYU22_04850, partial [Candidatus Woesearchaeota archaeon]|nr:hypothetical protein [Candidatus Woesearchaeota archaeon]
MDKKRGILITVLLVLLIFMFSTIVAATTREQAFIIKGDIDDCDDGIDETQGPRFCTDCGHTYTDDEGSGWPGRNEFPEEGCYLFSVEADSPDGNAYGTAALSSGFILPSQQEGGLRLTPTHEETKIQDDSEWLHPFSCNVKWHSNSPEPYICSSDHYWYKCDANEEGQILDITVADVPKRFICLAVEDYFKWEDTENLDLTVDRDQDKVPDVLDCAPDDHKVFPKFGCSTVRDAQGNDVETCITTPVPVCGDGIDNDCSINPGNPYNINDDCDLDQNSCETNCRSKDGKCSWRDSAESNKCCGDDGISEVGQVLRGREGTSYVCLNKENPQLLHTADNVINWAGCDDTSTSCWLAAANDPFHTYTLTKPGEQPYDVVSNNNNWYVCNATTGAGTLGINSGAAVIQPGDIKEANGLYCTQQGNRWGWAQCGDFREPIDSTARKVGDGPFALAIESITDNVVQLNHLDGRFDIPPNHVLEFRARFTGSNDAENIEFPADIQLFITGTQPNGERIIYLDQNVSSLAIGSPLLDVNRWMHLRVPLPEMLDIESIQLKAYPSENHMEVANVYLHPVDSTPPLCSGEGSTNHDETAWLSGVDFWQTRSYNAQELCNALYSPSYNPDDPTSKTAWLGSTVPGDKKCCGNTPQEYYAGASEENNGQFYGCWNSQPIASGETVMNVEVRVESTIRTTTFTYPEERFDVSLSRASFKYELLSDARYQCPTISTCDQLRPYLPFFEPQCGVIHDSSCTGPSADAHCSVTYIPPGAAPGDLFSIKTKTIDCTLTHADAILVDTYADLPADGDVNAIYLVENGARQGYYNLMAPTSSQDFTAQTLSLRNSPVKIESIEVNKEDFKIQDDYLGYLRLFYFDPSVEIYFLNPLEGNEPNLIQNIGAINRAEGGFITELDPKNLPAGKSTLYIMAEVNQNYHVQQEESPAPSTTTLTYTCTPNADGSTSCTYPLPGEPPYHIINLHPDLYELYFVSAGEDGRPHEERITAENQEFTVPGNLQATKVAQQVVFISQEEPDVDTGFYGCQAASYLEGNARAAGSALTNLPYCSVKAGRYCAYSVPHQPSDDPRDRFTTINSWDDKGLEKVGYQPLEASGEQPDINAFYANADVLALRDVNDQENDPFERNYSSMVLPARNIISNAEFQTTVRDLPHWEILAADGALLDDERSVIAENTITLAAGMLLRSERIAVTSDSTLHFSFTGTATPNIILVDKDGNRQSIRTPDFSTGDASYVILEFAGPGTVSQPQLQRVDELGPVPYQYDTQYSERAGAACCPQNYCWNGYACVEPMGSSTYLAEHIGDGRDYRCINGEWTHQPVKLDWNAQQWGFCSSKDQCLVLNSLQGGNSEKRANDFYQGNYPTC